MKANPVFHPSVFRLHPSASPIASGDGLARFTRRLGREPHDTDRWHHSRSAASLGARVRILQAQGESAPRRHGPFAGGATCCLPRSGAARRSQGRISRRLHPQAPDALTAIRDPKVQIVVELAGDRSCGMYVAEALKAGKPVVTANKSLLAARGPELFALAREQYVRSRFEASCGGGIPIIEALPGI